MSENIRYERLSDSVTAAQDERGLILTSDACLLAAFVSKNAKNRICELGAGSGVISLMLLERTKIRSSVCLDVPADMCRIAAENAESNGCADKMTAVCSDVLDYKTDRLFDAVVCNPPYFKSGDGKKNARKEDELCRHETTAGIDDFALCASRILKDGGAAYFCYTPGRAADLYVALRSAGLEPKTELYVYPTVKHKPSLLLVGAKKGAKSGLTCCKPLFLYKNGPGEELTEEYIKIKESMSIEILK